MFSGLMENPEAPTTVAPSFHSHVYALQNCSCHQSRPDRVFQPAVAGTYFRFLEPLSSPKDCTDFSSPYATSLRTFDSHSNTPQATASSNLIHEAAASPASMHAALPGRVYHSIMEDPHSPATVEPTCHRNASSRPGPVCSDGNGVFQNANSGKYTFRLEPMSPPLIRIPASSNDATSEASRNSESSLSSIPSVLSTSTMGSSSSGT